VDGRDNWQVHFADTMRGGQYINNWRMPSCTPKEAPDRVRELEAWGALFDAPRMAASSSATSAAQVSPAGARRRPTGLEMIRTLQDHSIHRHRGAHGVHRAPVVHRGGRIAGAMDTTASGTVPAVPLQGRHPRHRGIGRAYAITRTVGSTRDGHALAYHAGAALQDMEFVAVPSYGDDLAAKRPRILVTEGVRGEGGILLNKHGRGSCSRHPGELPEPDADNEEGGVALHQGDKNAGGRRAASRATTSPAPSCAKCATDAAARTAASSWTSRGSSKRLPNARDHIIRKLPSMYHQFKQLADIDITATPMEVGPTTHYIMGGVRVDGDSQMSTLPGLFAAGECAAGCTRQRLGGKLALRSAGLRMRGEFAARFAAENAAAAIDSAQADDAVRCALEPFERTPAVAAKAPTRYSRAAGDDADLVGSCATALKWSARSGNRAAAERTKLVGSPATGSTTRDGTPPGPGQPAHRLGGGHPAAIERKESRGGTSGRIFPRRSDVRQIQHRVRKAMTVRCARA